MAGRVTVEALDYHTHDGATYYEGDTYEVDAAAVDNLVAQRKAKVVESAPRAKALTSSKAGKLKPVKATKATARKKK
jgi:hypothetical protein